MTYDVVVVGGGIAGLTSAAFLAKDGFKVLVCEKEKKVGGLVNSFDFKGFTFDVGIRAVENSGILTPMLKQLGLDVDFVDNNVSLGIENDIIRLTSKDSIVDYQNFLNLQFPENTDDIEKIMCEIKRIMVYMKVLYGIDNPIFLDIKKDRDYFIKTILPWMFKYILTYNKISKLNTPVDEYLNRFTNNRVLIDMIGQHFFKKTPTFFALSYFSLYLDYRYPKGGTGALIDKMTQFIIDNKGEILTETEICNVNTQIKQIKDLNGNEFSYKNLIWASDLKKLYNIIDYDSIVEEKIKQKVLARKIELSDKTGGDSVYTVYLTVDMDKSFFEKICSAHFFYTPIKKGLHNIDMIDLEKSIDCSDKPSIISWLQKYYELTTFEISCPVLRDENLAPVGKTGLIISTLMDHSIVKKISDMGWYEEFKAISQEAIITIIDSSIFPGMKNKVINQFSSTPLTLEKLTGNSDGAITGWAFTNSFIPSVSSLPRVAKSVITPIPDIFQAGQWTYSPAGFPISILTGKLAADKAKKRLR